MFFLAEMELDQELNSLNKSVMADKTASNNINEPEAWYKVVQKDNAGEVVESLSHSEDELSLSHGKLNLLKKF